MQLICTTQFELIYTTQIRYNLFESCLKPWLNVLSNRPPCAVYPRCTVARTHKTEILNLPIPLYAWFTLRHFASSPVRVGGFFWKRLSWRTHDGRHEWRVHRMCLAWTTHDGRQEFLKKKTLFFNVLRLKNLLKVIRFILVVRRHEERNAAGSFDTGEGRPLRPQRRTQGTLTQIYRPGQRDQTQR